MNILIADDHAIVRKGLVQLVDSLNGVNSIDEAENGIEVLELYRNNTYDLVILDLSMPKKNGLDTLKEIININPEARVLILSVYPEEQYAIRSFNSGAYGYVTKNTAPKELLEALESVIKGRKYVSQSLAERLVNLKSIEKPLHENLSDREFQIMMMSADGYSISKIADELNISTKTVSTYRKRILDKMQFDNFIQVMQYAIENKL